MSNGAAPCCKQVLEILNAENPPIKIYLSQNYTFSPTTRFSVVETRDLKYHAFCDDFGPMNLSSIAAFVERLDKEIAKLAVQAKADTIVCKADEGPRALTNAAFFLGVYALLRLGMDPTQTSRCFKRFDPALFEPFRDATNSPADFHLHLIDCWSGIYRAQELKLLSSPSRQHAWQWGMVDLDEYELYDDPLNGNLHAVFPGKFVAFSGPKDLGGAEYFDDMTRGARSFSPKYYIDIFRQLGVSTVVRLNEPEYDRADFTSAGLQHFDLPFNDCTAPPPAVVSYFCRIASAAPGLVAVHCKSGLGRTGTLIALYMMCRHGFTAREAMGWLRVMRPGSVIGKQQDYLCEIERDIKHRKAPRQKLRRSDSETLLSGPPADSKDSKEGAAEDSAKDVGLVVARRGAGRTASASLGRE